MSKTDHETVRRERAASWISEFERSFVAGATGVRGADMSVLRRRNYDRQSGTFHSSRDSLLG
jgi:hypothetical protein